MPTKEFCGYELTHRLGIGGMALVWEARKKALNKRVAIKILRSEYAEDEDFARRFEREAMNSAKMEHPNIVQVTDYGRCEGTPFIEMEFIEGQDLSKVLVKSGPLPVEVSLLILRDVSNALAHAHAPGREVVHRDIKPSNVMFTTEGVVKLTDFGLARARLDDMSLTTSGLVMGTVPYMSPEQAAGQGMTKLSDIFSMGVMAFELLRGERPFRGESPSAVTRAIQEVEPPRLDRLNPLIPEPVAATVQQMLEKLPERRCQDIRDFERCLEEAIEKLGIVHERRLLREFSQKPDETAAMLRRRRIQHHLDQGLFFEKFGAGKIEDAALEFQRVLALDPKNETALQHLDDLRVASEKTLPYPIPGPAFVSRRSGRRKQVGRLWWALVAAVVVFGIVGVLLAGQFNRRRTVTAAARPLPSANAPTAGSGEPTPSTIATVTPALASQPASHQMQHAGAPFATPPPATTLTPAITDSGDVTITISPAATLVVDGAMRVSNQTAFTIRLPVGAHRIRAEHPQFDPKQWDFVLAGGGKELQWNFEEKAGRVSVSSLSDCWAWIRVDGQDTGQHTPASLPLRSGAHHIQVFKEGTTIPQNEHIVMIQSGRMTQATFDVPCVP